MKDLFKSKKIVSFIGGVALFTVILFFFLTTTVSAQSPNIEREFALTSITISCGDSLWSIANTYYTSEYESIENYINVIKKGNGLTSDTIYRETNLIVPYYKE